MAYRPIAKQGKKKKASTSKANSNDAFTSRQHNKDANVLNTSNTFEVLNNLDEGKNDENVPIFQSGTFMASGSGYGTKSLYERWKETKDDDLYDYDPYDDDVEYNLHNLSEDQLIFRRQYLHNA
nr:laccase [Tanacetum cinerariifolium]